MKEVKEGKNGTVEKEGREGKEGGQFIQPLQHQILPNKIFPFSFHFTGLFAD